MKPYEGKFPTGSMVRIVPRPILDAFFADWKLHHRLTPEMFPFAGREAKVVQVGYYHGGDVLYTLDGIPGTWHEQCLEETESL